MLEHAELADLLGLEAVRVVEHLAVAVAEDVGREPAADAEHARLQAGRDDRLHQRLAGLEVLAGDRRLRLARERVSGREIDGEVRRAVGVGDAFLQAGPGVDLTFEMFGSRAQQPLLEALDRLMHLARLDVDLGRAAPHRDAARRSRLTLSA